MTGQPNAVSSSCMTGAGSEAEDERMKRSLRRSRISLLRSARARIAWCMVGTAVYQLGWDSSSQAKNFSALKPGVQTTLPPAAMVESTAPISPWIWNSGMMLRQRSAGVRASVAPI